MFRPPPGGKDANFSSVLIRFQSTEASRAQNASVVAHRPNAPTIEMQDDSWKAEVRAVVGLLRSHLQQTGTVQPVAPETMHGAVETQQLLVVADVQEELTKERALSNFLRRKILNEKGVVNT